MKSSISISPSQEKRGRTALLVIDVQQGLFQQATPIYRAEEVLQNISMLIERARGGTSRQEESRTTGKGK